jgi:hypothetical protein
MVLFRGLIQTLSVWLVIVEQVSGNIIKDDESQRPLQSGHQTDEPDYLGLNYSSSAPHLFASTASLLQQWANTFFPNGHSMAGVTIPAYTQLYHGRMDDDPGPPSPEWLAFDIEMAYGITGSTRNSFLLTYQTSRPVRALYFDGESATLMGLGQLDTQMLLAFGNLTGPPPPGGGWGRGLWAEYARARGLCDWLEEKGLRGRGWGFEGVVRMNAGFELIWCDFNSPSLRLMSRLNVTAPELPLDSDEEERDTGEDPAHRDDLRKRQDYLPPDLTSYYSLPARPTRTDKATDPSQPPVPPNWRRPEREPFLASQTWGWFDSATWHYGSSGNGPGLGENRAKVDGCAILSFYSPVFVNQSLNRAIYERKTLNLTASGFWQGEGSHGNRTLALKQLARRRRFHHLGDINEDEAALMRQVAEKALKDLIEPYNECSEANWVLMTNEIIQQTVLQLKMFHVKVADLENAAKNATALREWLHVLRAQSHLFMVGFLEYPVSIDEESWETPSELFNKTLSRCRYRYTRLLAPDLGGSLSPTEADLRWAVEEVQGGICSVMLTVGFGIEKLWYELYGNRSKKSRHSLGAQQSRAHAQAARWNRATEELRAWLGWENQFAGCKEVCPWDERCYIPMWPLMAFPNFGRGPPRNITRPPQSSYPPYRGRPHFPGNGTAPQPPGFGRSPIWMGDDTDLWEPKCVKAEYIMGRR